MGTLFRITKFVVCLEKTFHKSMTGGFTERYVDPVFSFASRQLIFVNSIE